MTRDETIKLLMVIQSAYPNFKPPDKTVAVDTWHTMLKDMDYSVAQMGLRAYITSDTSGFAPSIGQLINAIYVIQNPRELNEMEAWSLVSKALRNGCYGAVDEFNKLPPLVQKAVGTPDNLRNWAQTDQKSIENVIQSNFIKTYQQVLTRKNEVDKMPPDIKVLIESTNTSSYLPQNGIENQKTVKISNEDIKSQNEPNKCAPMPKEIKERIEQMKR